MTCRFRQMLLVGSFLRRARFGRVLSITRLLFTLVWITGLLFALLRVARLFLLTLTITRLTLTRRRVAIVAGSVAVASLPVLRAGRAWSFSGKMVRRHEAVHCYHRNLAFDQSFDISEKR